MSAKVRPEVQATINRYRDACMAAAIAAGEFNAAADEMRAMVAKGMGLPELSAVLRAYEETESAIPRLRVA